MMRTRQAIYLAPPGESSLHAFARSWLGRDAITGERFAQPSIAGIAPSRLEDITRSPRRYGFHATLKAPFRLAEGTTVDLFHQTARAFAGSWPAFEIELEVSSLRGFIALTTVRSTPELERFEAACVRSFEPFRAPLNDEELERRRPSLLSEAQRANLERWGYPYVMEEFRFHMTLTDRLAGPEHDLLLAELRERTTNLVAEPFLVDRLCIFEELVAAGDFRQTAAYPLTG
ncbi:MAG: DUF1045 domain-containing protein [Pseudomonadota bacterium]